MRSTIVAGVGILGVFVTACGGGSASPSSPSTSANSSSSTAKVMSLKVSGPLLMVGDLAQFAATAKLQDGSSSDITSSAKWSSTDVNVATVSQTGMVTAVAEGVAEIKASYQGTANSARAEVKPLVLHRVYGVASEVPPGYSAVDGATIEATGGPTIGLVLTTDAKGTYDFGNIKEGTYTLTLTKQGYITLKKTISIIRDDRVDFEVYPVPPPGATARCKDKGWSFADTRGAACTGHGGVAYWVCPGPLCQ